MKIYKSKNVTASKSKNPDTRKVVASESTIRKSSPIMAGAGAGITIELSDITVQDTSGMELFNGATDRIGELADYSGTVDVSGTASGTIDIESIGTYYDGGTINMTDIPVNISVLEITPDDEDGFQTIVEEGIDYVLNDIYFDNPIHYGGGWTHVTFKGDITLEAYTDYATLKLQIEISDPKIVKYLDKYAHGDDIYYYYEIYADGEWLEDTFDEDERSLAIKTAQEYFEQGYYNDIEVWRRADREDMDGNFDIMDEVSEVVWRSYSEDDEYDEEEY